MRRALVLALVVPLLLASACGDDDTDDASPTETTAQPPGTSAGDDPLEPAAGSDTATTVAPDGATGSATVTTGDTSLGEVLVDADGMTLYAFTPDSATESTCTDGCLQAWPPLAVEGGDPTGEGVDAGMLGTLTRDDGTTQVSYNGHPLYTYAADNAPGDVTGQGVGDKWFVVGADGELIE